MTDTGMDRLKLCFFNDIESREIEYVVCTLLILRKNHEDVTFEII